MDGSLLGLNSSSTSISMDDNAVCLTPTRENESGIYTLLKTSMLNWEAKIIDNEQRSYSSNEFHRKMEETLELQMRDGLLSHLEFLDLKYVGNLWNRLSTLLALHEVGSRVCKREVVKILLELHRLEQIPLEIFVDVVMEL